ncbi:MAG: polysaccharide biosynthesis tyrosine autokinase [Bacteroides sp.]|uniref:GumC family protein n=1 Tax=Bacteroides sp. TaxID=29523 RepID=UPI002FCB4628
MVEKQTNKMHPIEDFIRIQDLWALFIEKWHWFALSLFISLSIAILYLLVTPSVYTRTASLLIKDDAKGGSSSAAGMADFSDLGIFKSNTNINNELLTLKSPTLMREVVIRLNAHETYTIKSGLQNRELYKESPISVGFIQPQQASGLAFTIELHAHNKFTLSDFCISAESIDQEIVGVIGDSVQTPAGILVLQSTAYHTKSYLNTPIRYSKADVERVTDFYTSELRVNLSNEDATIVNLSIDNASTQKAEDILNALIQVYNEKWVQDKNQIAISTSQFINDRLRVIETELGHVDDNISSFKSEHLLPDVQAVSNLYMNQSAENKKELLKLNVRLSTAKYIRKTLDKHSTEQLLPSESGIDNANVERQIGEYNALLLERNKLLANSSEKNPLVKDMGQSLVAMQQVIVKSVDNLIESLNRGIQNIRQQEVTTTGQIASSPNQAKYLISVERQQKIKEELYLYLLQKREENELSQAFTAYNTRLVTAPRGSLLPTAPRKANILLTAFAMGLLLPAVLIFVLENMNTKVRGRKDLERLPLPFAGEIPLSYHKKPAWMFWKKDSVHTPLVVEQGNRNIINEAFRVLRTNLEFMTGKEGESNVILVTSFNPGSGKTFITMNLAISLAIKGKKVVVIDGDMRHASLSTYVASPAKGLSSYLSKQLDRADDALLADDRYPTLHILPSGTIPPNPAELLAEDRFAKILATMRKQYDYVLIDCPPTGIVADTDIIEKHTDSTLFVVRSGLLDRSMIPELEQIYNKQKYKNIAIILNGTERINGRYGYKYGYGHGSYYSSHSSEE